MRITRTTITPVITKEMIAAGPVWFITAPLPTKRPAPITPPSEIIVMWRCRSERLRPVSSSVRLRRAFPARHGCYTTGMELRAATREEFDEFSRAAMSAFHREYTDVDRERYE